MTMTADTAAAQLVRAVGEPAGAWQTRAACRTADPELFAPTGKRSPDDVDAERQVARRYCAECPVLRDCRAFARRSGPRAQGVWGGEHRHTDTQAQHHVTPLLTSGPTKITRGRTPR